MKKKAKKSAKKKVGRPTKIDKAVVSKLEYSASIDCSISEMCFYADISRDTYYKLIKRDKKLSDRLTALRSKPVLTAREAVTKGVKDNPEFALKYLERKKSAEFGPKQKLEVDAKVKHNVHTEIVDIVEKAEGK